MAERKGFEPSVACATHAFQACAFDHSATSLSIHPERYTHKKMQDSKQSMAGGQGFEPWEV